MADFSDYIVYVDESGDHGLVSVDPNYPLFVLAFCIFKKSDYLQVVPALQNFKFKHFGHDQIILHEADIRKDRGDFKCLRNRDRKADFMNELTDVIDASEFVLIATVIKKDECLKRYRHVDNPYHIALGFGLERVFNFLKSRQSHQAVTHIVVEKRGKVEDEELELEFRRVCDGANYHRLNYPFEIILADKKSNSAGLQLADLVARPVGLSVIKPEQANRAFEILKKKFYCNGNGGFYGYGLKRFP